MNFPSEFWVTYPLCKSQISRWSLFTFFRFLSPLSAVPLVSLVGFGLFELGFPGVSLSYKQTGNGRITTYNLGILFHYKGSHICLGCRLPNVWKLDCRSLSFWSLFLRYFFQASVFSLFFIIQFSYKEDRYFSSLSINNICKVIFFCSNLVYFLCSICLTWSNLENTYLIDLQSFSVWC